MKARAAWLGIGMAASILSVATAANANGRFPATNQLVVMPGNPSTMAVRATFGMLFSSDKGATWDWICETAVGYGGIEDPAIGLTGGGSVLVAAFEGLAVSPDTGCAWSMVAGPLNGLFFVDVAVRPDNPHAAVALASTYDGEGGAQSYANQLFQTTDDGATWAPFGDPINPAFATDTVEVAASDSHRVYVTGATSKSIAALFVSRTDGTQWMEQDIPLVPGEASVYIGAVDPMNADRVYVRSGDRLASQSSRLLTTDNAGTSFTQRWSGGPMQGFALTPDGSKVFVGGPNDGLQVASTVDFAFTPRSSIPVQCLVANGTTLLACAPETSGFILGASSDEGMTFTPLLHLCGVRGPLACAASSPVEKCTKSWPMIQMTNGGPCPGDAGPPPPPGGDAGVTPPPGGSTIQGGGCAAVPGAVGALGSLLGIGAVSLLAALRRRKPGDGR